jgi:hypothetical protein
VKGAALFAVAAFLLGGCTYIEPGPSLFRVENHTGQTLVIGPRVPDPAEPPKTAEPGEIRVFDPKPDGCESRPWVATTGSGDVVAEIPGACREHTWTIRGLNDSTYG